jgi:Uncharacterized stress protein (general stress protein 26)
MSRYDDAIQILTERFGKDCLISIATADGTQPYVREVNGYFENGAFYVVTYALSNKIRQIEKNDRVAVCGDWFTAQGVGENLGHVLAEEHVEIMTKLRKAFSSWYDNGHTNEDDPNTCLLRVRLEAGVLMKDGEKYDINFVAKSA